MLYEMLAGVTPFRGEFEAALLYSIGNEEPAPIEIHRDDLPPHLRDLVGALLRKDPTQRPASMEEVGKILNGEAQVSQGTISAARHPAVTDPAQTERATTFFRSWWLYGSGILLLSIVGVFVYSILTPTGTRRISPGLSKSIAILPCSFTGGQEGSFLGDAIAAEIRRYLVKFPGLMAVSSSSTQYFSDRSPSDSALFLNLGVNFLLKGQVRLTSAGLTLDVSLVSKERNEEAWERHYAYAQKEIQLLPSAVSADVAGVLGLPKINIRSVETTDRPDVYQWYLEGLHYYEMGEDRSNRKMAREYFTNAVNNDSDFIPALLGLAGVRLSERVMGWDNSGGTLGAIEAICRRIIGLDSTNASAYALLGKLLDLSGDRSGGMRYLERALAIDPYNLTALRFLSGIYMIELGDPTKGLVIFEKLQWIEPANWWVKLSLGVAHSQMNDFEGGISLFRSAAALNPRHPYPLFNLGYAFEHLMNADSAEWFYRKSIGADPTFSSAISSLAGLLIAQHRCREADSLLEGARKAVEGDPDLLYLHGIVESCRGRTAVAKEIFQSGLDEVRNRLRQQPSDPGLIASEGLYSVRLGERIDPAVLAGEILRIDSIHEGSILGVVRLFALTREKEKMLEWFGRVRKMNSAEYNEGWLKTAVDFEYFRNDPDLLKILVIR
jgi:tetratricopeptide (TPR) repeat protein